MRIFVKKLIKNQSISVSVSWLLSAISATSLLSGIAFANPASTGVSTSATAPVATPATPAPMGPVKTYQVLRVKQVVSNSEQCGDLYSALKSATDQPLALQFSPHPVKSDHFLVSDASSQLISHEFTIVDQEVSADGSQIHRVGMGMFSVSDGQKTYPVNYVINIDADTNQANFKYLYPMILSGENGHCEYIAVIQPDKKTVAALKSNLKSGQVVQKSDLSAMPVKATK